MQQAKALGTLTGYAFITERQQAVPGSCKERVFDMHRLVYMALTWWLEGHGERAAWAGTAAARANELVPYGGHQGKEVWVAYLPHVTYVAGLVDAVDGAMSATLLERLGRCHESLGQYASAEASHRKASSLRKEVLGLEHPDTLGSINDSASVLYSQGKYEDAEAMNRQTLARQEKVLGLKHPDTLESMNNLASVLYSQGKYEDAEAINRQTLARQEKVLGPEHPNTLASINNLASVLYSQGKYEDAEAMNRQTLARAEKVLGPEHPNALASVHWLAHLLAEQHRVDESLLLYQRACTGYDTTLGKDHPITVACHKHYAALRAEQEQEQLVCSPSTPDGDARTSTKKRSRQSRELADISIRSSKYQRR